MSSSRSLVLSTAVAALSFAFAAFSLAFAPPVLAGIPKGGRAAAPVSGHALFQSRQLWATIDLCNPSDQPDMVGIRGSMPGDGSGHDTMYMRFRLQYQDPASKGWIDLAHGADSGFVAVGRALSARQAGRSFQLAPASGKPASTLRGVVSFQWRQGARVTHAVSRVTSAGHQSLAGADPANFSSALCVLR